MIGLEFEFVSSAHVTVDDGELEQGPEDEEHARSEPVVDCFGVRDRWQRVTHSRPLNNYFTSLTTFTPTYRYCCFRLRKMASLETAAKCSYELTQIG